MLGRVIDGYTEGFGMNIHEATPSALLLSTLSEQPHSGLLLCNVSLTDVQAGEVHTRL